MAVAPKGKRKILVGGRDFYWSVKDDPDSPSPKLSVLSPDKRFIVQYTLGQAQAHSTGWEEQWQPPFVEVLGSEFGGLERAGVWRRLRTPTWGDDTAVTPAFVHRLIEWCLDPEKEVVRVDWRGRMLSEGGAAEAC
jgi:hypothetical protein